jgi:tetratricopeptide (TPR) repeat protein
MKRFAALALLLAALGIAPLAAQEDTKLEAEAKKAFDSGRFKEAGDKYAKAAEAAGLPAERQADLHLQSAWSYYIAGSSKRAREELKAAVTARPDLQVIPDFYSPDFANLAGAVRAEVAGTNVPAYDVEELKRSARAKLADGKAEEALQDLKRASSSRDPEVFRIQAEASERLGRTADAEAARQRAAELEKGTVSSAPIGAAPLEPGTTPEGASFASPIVPLLESAEKALASGDYRASASFARQASESDPKSAEAHRLLGDASLLGGQGAEAEREFTAAIVLEPGNTKAVFGLATLAEQQKKWNTAASLYRRVLDLDPTNVPAARGLGRSLSELGDKSAARIAFGRAIENDPASAESRNDLGVFLFRAGELDRSIEELIEAVRLDDTKAVYHENLGRAYRKKGMAKEAERELADAARLAPNDAGVWTALGQVRAEQRRVDEAATAFSTALSLDPSSEEAATALGAVLADAGKLAEAETALTKAIENNAKSPALWNNLGATRVRRGNNTGAIEAFQKALSMDAGFDAARTNLNRATELAALEKAAS